MPSHLFTAVSSTHVLSKCPFTFISSVRLYEYFTSFYSSFAFEPNKAGRKIPEKSRNFYPLTGEAHRRKAFTFGQVDGLGYHATRLAIFRSAQDNRDADTAQQEKKMVHVAADEARPGVCRFLTSECAARTRSFLTFSLCQREVRGLHFFSFSDHSDVEIWAKFARTNLLSQFALICSSKYWLRLAADKEVV